MKTYCSLLFHFFHSCPSLFCSHWRNFWFCCLSASLSSRLSTISQPTMPWCGWSWALPTVEPHSRPFYLILVSAGKYSTCHIPYNSQWNTSFSLSLSLSLSLSDPLSPVYQGLIRTCSHPVVMDVVHMYGSVASFPGLPVVTFHLRSQYYTGVEDQ